MSRASTPSFPWLRLHSRLAATRYWQERLTVCGAGALVFSFIAWLLGAHPLWHLGFIALGSALGFLPRLRSSQGWALHWLDTHLGLSYRTALEVPRDEDHYGLYTALQRRVERASKNIERPSPQPWWLPLFALAFGLLLVPNVPWSAASPLSSAPGMSGPEAPPAASAEDPEETAAEELAGDEPESPEGEGVDAPADAPEGAAGEGKGGRPGQDGRAPEEGAESERQALEDFLRSFEDEEPEEEEAASEGTPSGRPGEEGAADERQGPAQAREDDGHEPGDTGDAGDRGDEPGAGSEPGAEPGEGDEAQAAEAGEEAGEGEERAPQAQQQAQQEAGSEGDEEGAGGGEGQEEGLEDTGEEGLGEASSDEGAEAQAQQGAEGGEDAPSPEGDGEGDLDPGGGVGAEGPAGGDDDLFAPLEREQERPEFVPGQRDEGGEAARGVVRLPGGGQAEGPAGAAPQSFERGLERAITEGRIPVEYHEVLRDYFR